LPCPSCQFASVCWSVFCRRSPDPVLLLAGHGLRPLRLSAYALVVQTEASIFTLSGRAGYCRGNPCYSVRLIDIGLFLAFHLCTSISCASWIVWVESLSQHPVLGTHFHMGQIGPGPVVSTCARCAHTPPIRHHLTLVGTPELWEDGAGPQLRGLLLPVRLRPGPAARGGGRRLPTPMRRPVPLPGRVREAPRRVPWVHPLALAPAGRVKFSRCYDQNACARNRVGGSYRGGRNVMQPST